MPRKPRLPSSLEICLLGPFHILVDDKLVEERRWSRHKPQLLVKLLALSPGHRLHREQLMELLWPEHAQQAAASNLHRSIYIARQALEPGLTEDSQFILTRGSVVGLHASGGLRIDVEVFEQRAAQASKSDEAAAYEAALTVYRGELLVDDMYEDWVVVRREQLHRLYRELVVNLARVHEAGWHFTPSIERLTQLVAADPLDEEVQRRLMRLYARAGSQRLALRQYQVLRDALHHELAVEPEASTILLGKQILGGHFAPGAPQDASAPHAAANQPHDLYHLAVLPVVSAGANASVQRLCGYLTRSLINRLAQLPGLQVRARDAAVVVVTDQAIDVVAEGRGLGAQAVLAGSVVKQRGELLISLELVDVQVGSRLWLAVQQSPTPASIEQLGARVCGYAEVLLRYHFERQHGSSPLRQAARV